MLRFIIKRSIVDTTFEQYPDREDYYDTIDVDIPALEAMLSRGGRGPSGYDRSTLMGVSVLPLASEGAKP